MNDDQSLYNTLNFLEKQILISGEFAEKVHLCPFCSSAFLNFTENCLDCHSSNLLRDDIIHHFICGHAGPASLFKNENTLVCPKCDETLKHIGVDYDKPSTIYSCNECSLEFQEALVNVTCFNCHRSSAIDDVIKQDIKNYHITSIGENAARFGLDALFTSILKNDMALYSIDEFKAFTTVENLRIERYKKSDSSLACVHLSNIEDTYRTMGKQTEQLFKELSVIFKSVFRESDIITALNESMFLILMIETTVEQSENAILRLEGSLLKLLESFAQNKTQIGLKYKLKKSSECSNIEALVEETLK